MANTTEYSRLVFKRSTVSGVVPTIPTGTTIDSSWTTTDILIGEGFINVADDRFWFRTDNGIVEVALSGNSMYRYTTGATLVGNIAYFDRYDQASAYTLDLSSLVVGSGSYLPLTGGTVTGNLTVQNTNAFNVYVNGLEIISVGTGSTSTADVDTYGTILSSRDSRMNSSVRNSAVIAATGITASASNTLYTENFDVNGTVRLGKIGSATPIINLGIDSNGNIVTGTTGGGSGIFTGGTLAGATTFQSTATFQAPVTINSTLTVTGDTVLREVSASTFTIINSGATTRNYTDYSSNIIRTGVTNSTIAAGSGNTISANLRNVFVAGVGLSATTNDSAYFSKIYSGSTELGSLFKSSSYSPTAGNYIGVTGSSVVSLTGVPMDISFAISDETTAITSGTSKLTLYAPYAFTITKVIATLSTSGSSLSEFDVNINGSSIFSRRPTIDANEFHSDDAAAGAPSLSTTSVAYKDKFTIDIDQAGTGAAGAKIYILGNRNL